MFYECRYNNKYVPRCLMFDLDATTIDRVRKGKNQ